MEQLTEDRDKNIEVVTKAFETSQKVFEKFQPFENEVNEEHYAKKLSPNKFYLKFSNGLC